jgi:hypothetical protein
VVDCFDLMQAASKVHLLLSGITKGYNLTGDAARTFPLPLANPTMLHSRVHSRRDNANGLIVLCALLVLVKERFCFLQATQTSTAHETWTRHTGTGTDTS